MAYLHRRTLLAAAALAAVRPTRAAYGLGEREAANLLGIENPDDFLQRKSNFLVIAPWGAASDRLWAACVADEDHAVTAAILQEDADGTTRRVVAGPVDADVLSIDPFWTLDLAISPMMPLGPEIPAFGVTVSNSYLSTGRSTWSQSMSIFLREGNALRPVFSGYVGMGSSEEVPCRRRRPDGEPCREAWESKWVIKAEGTAPRGTPPTLVVVDRKTKRTVSRHVWRGTEYHPPSFEHTPHT